MKTHRSNKNDQKIASKTVFARSLPFGGIGVIVKTGEKAAEAYP